VKTLLAGVMCVVSGLSADQPVRELSTQAVPFAKSQVPWFRHGYLILFPPGGPAGSPLSSIDFGFYAYAPDGTFAFNKNIELPDASQPVVRDVDFDANGNAAVGASALGGFSAFRHGILLLDRTGQQTAFIDTGRYDPAHLAIAPDRSIWALGWQMDADNPPHADRQDYMILRHFSADGKELKAWLPRSSFPAGLEPGIPGPWVRIEVTGDRVGILVSSGKTSSNAEWIELDLNGNLVERSRVDSVLPQAGSPIAFTADDHVYFEGHKGELYTLDADSHMWKSVRKQGDVLMGADGESLVYRKRTIGPIQLEWFNQPQ
jgi:hypothetical protein